MIIHIINLLTTIFAFLVIMEHFKDVAKKVKIKIIDIFKCYYVYSPDEEIFCGIIIYGSLSDYKVGTISINRDSPLSSDIYNLLWDGDKFKWNSYQNMMFYLRHNSLTKIIIEAFTYENIIIPCLYRVGNTPYFRTEIIGNILINNGFDYEVKCYYLELKSCKDGECIIYINKVSKLLFSTYPVEYKSEVLDHIEIIKTSVKNYYDNVMQLLSEQFSINIPGLGKIITQYLV